jgi:hypothetical protein|tara:strand:- start:2707 stop:3294 length:588 start_codon:yes stop_codon:yes gene_type:complete
LAVDERWEILRDRQTDPACGATGCWSFHARYQKYHFENRIDIRRVRCTRCGTTHALIPIFSVPQTSYGRKEVEEFFAAREKGMSRPVSCRPISAHGWEGRVAKRLEGRLQLVISRAKAIWPHAAELTLSPLAWIRKVCGPTNPPLAAMNTYALDHGVNAICFCRSSVLFFPPRAFPEGCSHNHVSTASPRAPDRM